MDCPKCGGLMVMERFLDLQDDRGRGNVYGLRCVICGTVVDPLILKNRKKQAGKSQLVH